MDCSRVIVRDARSLRLHIFEDSSLRRVFFIENMKTLSMTLDEIDMGYVSSASILFTDLFLGKTAVKAIEKAKEVGLKVSIVIPHGLSVMGLWGLGREDVLRAVELADLVATSVPVAADYFGETDPQRLLEAVSAGSKVVALTAGGEGSYVTDGKYGYRIPAPKVEVVDTTGAGDTYAATLTYFYLAKGLELLVSARLASIAASLKCTRMGAWRSPRMEELIRFEEKVHVRVRRIF